VRRRKFVALLGGAAVWPLAARAQQAARMRRIGVLMSFSENEPEGQTRMRALQQGLQELGWTGLNLQVDTRWAGGDINRMQNYAAELVGLAPDLIVGNSTAAVSALQRATRSIPIVFVLIVNDPVDAGFVSSIARPGGNITGFTYFQLPLIGKWLELIKQTVPGLRRAALLFNPDLTGYYYKVLSSFGSSQQSVTVELEGKAVRNITELEGVIAAFARDSGSAILVPADPFIGNNLGAIARLASRLKLPTVSIYRQYVVEGGLMSYGPDTADIFRRSASYVDRILKGQKPADLPVQEPIIYNFAINLRSAKTFGLEVPPTLLALADEVIE
jgi:putative tryptophan/tyrosine transport system substrate-binding protein